MSNSTLSTFLLQEGPGSWMALLRITAYKGIGKHSSHSSPAMNFDRSAVSLRLNMEKFPFIMLTKLTGPRTSTFLYMSQVKCVTSMAWPFLATSKLWRGSLDDATQTISRLYARLFQTRTLYKPMQKHMTPRTGPFSATGG